MEMRCQLLLVSRHPLDIAVFVSDIAVVRVVGRIFADNHRVTIVTPAPPGSSVSTPSRKLFTPALARQA